MTRKLTAAMLVLMWVVSALLAWQVMAATTQSDPLTATVHVNVGKWQDTNPTQLYAELDDFVETPYKHLSSGMKVRLAFSVVSQLDEPILLVDEVLAVGDKAFREKCYRRIDELLAEGRTLFFVSHNEKDLRRFCTRGLYLDKGALNLDAPISDVLDAYNADHAPR